MEESILADPHGTHLRRTWADGSTVDLTALNEYGIVLEYVFAEGDRPWFIDLLVVRS